MLEVFGIQSTLSLAMMLALESKRIMRKLQNYTKNIFVKAMYILRLIQGLGIAKNEERCKVIIFDDTVCSSRRVLAQWQWKNRLRALLHQNISNSKNCFSNYQPIFHLLEGDGWQHPDNRRW